MDYSIDEIPKITKFQLRKLLVKGTHLNKWQGYGIEGLRTVFKEQGFIQIDPLNPAGRYHDFFLFARIPDYKQGYLERILYPEGLVFEDFLQMMCFIHREHFPLFYYRRQEKFLHTYYQKQMDYIHKNHPTYFDDALKLLEHKGAQNSSILKNLGETALGKSRWKDGIFKTNIFELLYHYGKTAIVAREKNFTKVYDLVERKYNAEELKTRQFSEDRILREKLFLLQKSYPVLDSRLSITKSGKLRLSSARDARIRTIKQLTEIINPTTASRNPTLVHLEENNRVYVVPNNWREIIKNIEFDSEIRAIGPLDPMIRDRECTEIVFDFIYRWEIYTPENQRKWGYYLLPLLYKDKLIGRIEPSLKVKDNILRFLNFYTEKNTKWTTPMEKGLERLLLRWKDMVNADDLDLSGITPLN